MQREGECWEDKEKWQERNVEVVEGRRRTAAWGRWEEEKGGEHEQSEGEQKKGRTERGRTEARTNRGEDEQSEDQHIKRPPKQRQTDTTITPATAHKSNTFSETAY